jgi:hypothetical protein
MALQPERMNSKDLTRFWFQFLMVFRPWFLVMSITSNCLSMLLILSVFILWSFISDLYSSIQFLLLFIVYLFKQHFESTGIIKWSVIPLW